MSFGEFEPTIMDNEAYGAAVDGVLADFEAATNAQERRAAVQRWDEMVRQTVSWESWVYIRFSQDTTDPVAKANKDKLDRVGPGWVALENKVKQALSQSEHRHEVEQWLGGHVFDIWAGDLAAFEPAIQEDMAQESKLVSEYMQLMGGMKIQFKGKDLNYAGLMKFREDPDRDVRYESNKLLWGWVAQHQAQFDRIFDDLVKLRHGMARKLGYDNYIPMGYHRMKRAGYDQHDVARFRDEIVAKAVPLVGKLRQVQSQRLGIEKLMAWDTSLYSPGGNPAPKGDAAWMSAQAQTMFEGLNGQMASFYKMMNDRGLLDLETRDGKSPGGFCTFMPDLAAPFIFANFNGTSNDVRVFTHEAGHAFQSWSCRDASIMDYVWPS